jgi:hypothetical protein
MICDPRVGEDTLVLELLASFFRDAEIPLEGNIEALALQIVRFSHARTGSDHRLWVPRSEV